MNHFVLLGDSIFDNAAYVHGQPDVSGHLRTLAPQGSRVTLCAVDGSTTRDVSGQIRLVPPDGSHLILSVGGNDALGCQHVLTDRAVSAAHVLEYLSIAVEEFGLRYRSVLNALTALRRRVIVCTIYNGNLPQEVAAPARAAIAIFNDRIYQVANECGVAVLELRRLCTNPSDYANPIEPSAQGGRKIAAAILSTAARLRA